MYYAHISEDGRKQTVEEHITGTAEKAKSFAKESFKEMAYFIGKMHDIGKFSDAFQKRLHGSNVKFEHSICGALECRKMITNELGLLLSCMAQYCIAGHHTGLPDGGSKADIEGPSLYGRLYANQNMDCYSDYREYVDAVLPHSELIISELISRMNKVDKAGFWEKYAFFTRYLFSCLTDADYLDTEIFCKPDTDRETRADFKAVSSIVEKNFSKFTADTELKKARSRLQKQAYSNAENGDEISILNMPTGSGKTLCSLKIALDKLGLSKKRIIYVIPYTSIIEQTGNEFEKLFGEKADIVQHHSNYVYETDDEDADNIMTIEKLKRATENWDAPVIITTSVQFFQSLYHHKGSSLRKLHNMADSIIVFDEIHLLPLELLQPCLRGIGYITKYLGSEAIFLSATMPDYTRLFEKYLPECRAKQLITDRTDFCYFQKCRYINMGMTDYDNIIEKAQNYSSSLIIVNKRKTAQSIYKSISGNKYHLSTYMTPNDRFDTIEKIKADLRENVPITVVSTSLVEAGVDLDFEAVFRQIAGIDSILQSGGRCNREGKRECGDVYIFETDDDTYASGTDRVIITKDLMKKYDNISSPECIEEYYNRLFKLNEPDINSGTIAGKCNIAKDFVYVPFREYSDGFKMINEDSVSVVIDNCEKTAELLVKGEKKARRKLQKYSISLRRVTDFKKAFDQGLIMESRSGVFVLSRSDYYSKEIGIDFDYAGDCFIE